MKTLVASGIVVACTLSCIALAQPGSHDQALRELNIMRNIFSAAMQGESNRRFSAGSADALYLAGQGMVFTFDLPGRGWLNISGLEKLQALDSGFVFDAAEAFLDDDFSTDPRFSGLQQQLRDIGENMRDKQREMRDKQREMRDLQQAQLRGGTNGDSAAMESLSDELENLGKDLATLGESIKTTQQTYDAERKAQTAQLQQAYATRIFGTLCDYGNTLRSLASGEHVNIVLRNHEENQAQVYVVDYSALASCSAGESLQQGAVSYTQSLR